jgi:hypothetical protein
MLPRSLHSEPLKSRLSGRDDRRRREERTHPLQKARPPENGGRKRRGCPACPLVITSWKDTATIPPLRNGRRRRCSGRDDRTREGRTHPLQKARSPENGGRKRRGCSAYPLVITSWRDTAAIPPLRNGRRRRCSGRDDRTGGHAKRRRGRENRAATVPSATLPSKLGASRTGGMTR